MINSKINDQSSSLKSIKNNKTVINDNDDEDSDDESDEYSSSSSSIQPEQQQQSIKQQPIYEVIINEEEKDLPKKLFQVCFIFLVLSKYCREISQKQNKKIPFIIRLIDSNFSFQKK